MTPTTTVYKLAEQGGREEKGGGGEKEGRKRERERESMGEPDGGGDRECE